MGRVPQRATAQLAIAVVALSLAGCDPSLPPEDAGARDAGTDAGPGDAVPCLQVPLTSFPEHGDVCDPAVVPEGHVCRLLECNSGCRPTCECLDGRWFCADACIDWPASGGAYCGRAPACVDFRVCVGWPRGVDFLPCLIDADCPAGERCAEDTESHGRCTP